MLDDIIYTCGMDLQECIPADWADVAKERCLCLAEFEL